MPSAVTMEAAALLPANSAGLDLTDQSPVVRCPSSAAKSATSAFPGVAMKSSMAVDSKDDSSSDHDSGDGSVSSSDSSSSPPPRKKASVFSDVLLAAQSASVSADGDDGATQKNQLVVLEGAIALANADASRGKSKKKDYVSNTKTPADDAAASLAGDHQPAQVAPQKSWQQRAKECDWSNTQSILANFGPKTKKRSRQNLYPPLYMVNQYDCVLLKAHATSSWYQLSHQDQHLLKKQFVEMGKRDRYDQKQEIKATRALVRKARTKVAKMKRKERGKEERKRKREEKIQARAAAKLVLHLKDKASSAGDGQLDSQFAETDRSSTPPPDIDADIVADTLTKEDAMLVCRETSADGTKKNLRIYIGNNSGIDAMMEMVQAMIASGNFDDIVRDRVRRIESGLAAQPNNMNVEIINSGADVRGLHAQFLREVAEQNQSMEEIANDPKIGVITGEVSEEELERMM